MKVLTIMVDVSKLSPLEISELAYAMEVQAEDAGGKDLAEKHDNNSYLFDAEVLKSSVKTINMEDILETH